MNTQQVKSKFDLIRNGIWNLLGHGTPLLCGLVAIPLLIHHLGKDRFGILTIGWVIILWSGLLPHGVSLSLTKQVSEKLIQKRDPEISSLTGTGLFVLFCLGVLESLVLVGIAPWLTQSLLNIPQDLQNEALSFFYILPIIIPFANLSIGLIAILEGQQKFRTINLVRIPTSLSIFMVPLFVLLFSKTLPWIITSVLAVLIASVIALWFITISTMPLKYFRVRFKKLEINHFFKFGSWIFLGTSLAVIMNNLPRFFLGTLLTLTAVTYYTTPQEAMMGLLIVPISFVQVMFPAFASNFKSDPKHALKLFNGTFKYLFLIIFPIVFSMITFGPEALGVWLGGDFAVNSGPVLRWMALGVFINSFAILCGNLINASGRPDLTGKILLLEFPLFIVFLYFVTKTHGIQGTAIVFSGRMMLNGLLMLIFVIRILSPIGRLSRKPLYFLLFGFLSFSGSILLEPLYARSLYWFILILFFLLIMWKKVLKPEDRNLILKRIQWSKN